MINNIIAGVGHGLHSKHSWMYMVRNVCLFFLIETLFPKVGEFSYGEIQ